MLQLRTQIYLEPTQHAALLKEARRLGLSLAAIIRKLVDEHFRKRGTTIGAEERKKASLSLIGLGASGLSDVSQKADEYLGQSIYQEMVRDRRVRYKKASRKRR